jgi:hypothetical protein
MGKYRKKSFTLIRQGVNQGNRVGTRDSSKQSKGIGAPGGIVIPMKMFVEPRKKSHHANDREKADENQQPNLKS